MIKRLLLSLSLVVLVPLSACAQDAYEGGKDYDLIVPALRTANPDKIEVAEFFWYGCSHCYTFEPLVNKWKETMAEDVAFRGVPAMWGGSMELHAKAYFTVEVLGLADTMHTVVFQAMNVDRNQLRDDKAIAKLFVDNGVAEADFYKAYNSFGVGSQVRQANSTARAAKITGTPSMMVNGKYLITTRKAGGNAQMLEIADFLVNKERAEQKMAQEKASASVN